MSDEMRSVRQTMADAGRRTGVVGGHSVIAYRYGLRGDLPPEAIEELGRSHRLSNQLVAIERAHGACVATIWTQHPEVAAADAELTKAVETLEDALAAATRERQERRPPAQSSESRLREARALVVAARVARGKARRAAYEVLKPAIVEARRERARAIKATYAPFRDGGGYWANWNEVVARHEASTRALGARHRSAQRGELRFRMWDGSGTLAVQVQRVATDPVPDAQMLASSDSKWRQVLSLCPYLDSAQWAGWTRAEKRQRGRGVVAFRIGAGDASEVVHMPVVLHRPLRPDAEVKLARITRRMIGGRARCTVSFVCRVPQPSPRAEDTLIAVHLGWRRRPDGGVRAATIAGAEQPADSLAGLVRPLGVGRWEVVTPRSWEDMVTQLAHLASRRDRNHTLAKSELIDWIGHQPEVPSLDGEALLCSQIKAWRSPRHLTRVAMSWREEGPKDAMATRLEAWRRQDRHLWSWHANLAQRLARCRTDAWGKVAAWVCAQAGQVVIDDWSITHLAAVKASNDPYVAPGARRLRSLVSPGGLRKAIERGCRREGIELRRLTIPDAVHHACGGPLEGDRVGSVMLYCPSCEVRVDQDLQVVDRMIAVTRDRPATTARSARPSSTKGNRPLRDHTTAAVGAQ